MTTRHLAEITADELQQLAHQYGGDIEIDNANGRAFFRLGNATYVAELTEPCS